MTSQTRVFVARVNKVLTSDKSDLTAAIFFNRDGRLGNLDGSKNGFRHGE